MSRVGGLCTQVTAILLLYKDLQLHMEALRKYDCRPFSNGRQAPLFRFCDFRSRKGQKVFIKPASTTVSISVNGKVLRKTQGCGLRSTAENHTHRRPRVIRSHCELGGSPFTSALWRYRGRKPRVLVCRHSASGQQLLHPDQGPKCRPGRWAKSMQGVVLFP